MDMCPISTSSLHGGNLNQHNYEWRTLFLWKSVIMEYHSLSNQELLASIIGEAKAAELYRGTLRPLFTPSNNHEGEAPLLAARELVRRYLAEELFRESVFTKPEEVKEYLRLLFSGYEHEVFVVLFLDTQHRLIAAEELFRGTISQTAVYPREVVKRSLAVNAAALILAHNHPSGVPEPSQADIHLTRQLTNALSLVDIRVLDHIVVAGSAVVSFSERGMV
jgi:DNA repair protein RadC